MIETASCLQLRGAWPSLSGLLGLVACGAVAPAVNDVGGLPCITFHQTHRPHRICAAQPAPSAEVARQVKAFAPEQDSAQLLVHWLERAGATRPLTLRVDGRTIAELVPAGLVRIRLDPGPHELSVTWSDQQAAWPLRAQAGMVQFAEIGGRFKFRDVSFGWTFPEGEGARRRAAGARVIADVDLRLKPEKVGGSVTPSP